MDGSKGIGIGKFPSDTDGTIKVSSDTVQARLDDLGGQIERLDTTIEILEKHLGLVLRPYREDTIKDSARDQEEDSLSSNSAIADEIERYTDRIRRAIRNLDIINERIHL